MWRIRRPTTRMDPVRAATWRGVQWMSASGEGGPPMNSSIWASGVSGINVKPPPLTACASKTKPSGAPTDSGDRPVSHSASIISQQGFVRSGAKFPTRGFWTTFAATCSKDVFRKEFPTRCCASAPCLSSQRRIRAEHDLIASSSASDSIEHVSLPCTAIDPSVLRSELPASALAGAGGRGALRWRQSFPSTTGAGQALGRQKSIPSIPRNDFREPMPVIDTAAETDCCCWYRVPRPAQLGRILASLAGTLAPPHWPAQHAIRMCCVAVARAHCKMALW